MKSYRVLVADPPWPFRDSLPGRSRGAGKNYNLLTLEEIQKFKLPTMKFNSWLFLWRVSSMQEEALKVVRTWGFTPKAELVWNKLTSKGLNWFGMGHYLRASHESCIVAIRGRVVPRVRNIRSTFADTSLGHSRKPEMFYNIVEKLSDGPYCELFARRKREGWDCFGDEI